VENWGCFLASAKDGDVSGVDVVIDGDDDTARMGGGISSACDLRFRIGIWDGGGKEGERWDADNTS
jgi:hypothetical protein